MEQLEALSIQLELPDLWQQEAVRCLRAGKSVVIDAPTGAGKTFVFELLVKSGALKGQAIYTVPTRALANDKWREWKQAGWDVGIATGDLATNTEAPVVVATLETQREKFLNRQGPALLVVDEYQMIGDSRRGLNYELGIALSPPDTQLLLLSGSVANPGEIVDWMQRLGRDVALIQTQERPVPLDDIPLLGLPYRAPNSTKGFWPRAALATLMSDFGPLLIFSPHRKTAEKIAAQISEALPLSSPIELTRSQEQALGSKLARMVQNRVAYHHSGLSYAQRAGIIEPLAKAGQLRVIVATTGLAAGINFSVRSVFISETRYFEGPFEREIAPDELLQMFGRAGRRGLDENGYVLSAERSPRLSDARPKHLHRTNEIDWPTLLRVMHAAKLSGESPFNAAKKLCDQLFSRQSIRLGFEDDQNREGTPPHEAPKSDSNLFGLGPTKKEVRNSKGEWETEDATRLELVVLREAWILTAKKGCKPALKVGGYMQTRVQELGRLCKLQQDGTAIYGAELAVANVLGEDVVRMTKRWRSLARISKKQSDLKFSELEALIGPVIAEIEPGAALTDLQRRGRSIIARVDLANTPVEAYQDSLGKWLIAPERRTLSLEAETGYYDAEKDREFRPPANSAAYAWRKLGVVDADGGSTRRGRIFSFFNQGEGFAVAAALEDETYPIDELAFHLANVRAGHRFESDTRVSGASERLGAVCRQTYGPVDYEGYLRLGLPVGYGEGAAEVVEMSLTKSRAWRAETTRELGQGDVERAVVEWLSLLRHIKNAPILDWERWLALKEIAADLLGKHSKDLQQSAEFAMIEPHILHRKVHHRISLKQANQQHHAK
tara:strand:- start:11296 stop:13806 length:2511 start_codon:yes stop_codon:yes gene_type:complete